MRPANRGFTVGLNSGPIAGWQWMDGQGMGQKYSLIWPMRIVTFAAN